MNDLNRDFSKTVKVKRACEWQEFDTARLQISVGQPYHESAELAATIRWALSNFQRVQICVNDTLQRHNFEFEGLNQEDAYAKSEATGREWVERNAELIRSPRIEIIRWEQWRREPEYQSNLERIKDLYDRSDDFQEAIRQEIDNFWERRKKNYSSDEETYNRFARHSKEYLLEECAVFLQMFARDQAADIYPGSTLLPCSQLKGMGKYGFTRIDFTPIKKVPA